MPGAASNNPYYENSDLPDEIRDMMNEYNTEKKKIMPPNIILPEDQIKRDMQEKQMKEFERILNEQTRKQANITEVEKLRREMKAELEELKEGMRKMGILFDSDLPDEEAFKKYRMLQEAYKKYKMVERLVLGQDE